VGLLLSSSTPTNPNKRERERELGLVESTYNEGGKNSNQIKSNLKNIN
jgi:hypothetical protein